MSESKTSPPTPAFRSSLEGLEPLKNPSSLSVYENWALGELSAGEKDEIQANYEKSLIDNLEKNQRSSGLHLFHLADVLPTFTEGLQTLVDDSFTKCFSSHKYVNWNWNIYLFPVWLVGLFVRYCVLFPLRLLCLIAGSSIVFGLFPLVSILAPGRAAREKYQSYLVRLFATTFVASWSGVIRYHGVPPKRAPDQIYVANHTSLIDVVILEQSQAFSIVGQKHVGPVGFLQDYVLGCLGCLWFERNEQKDRLAVSRRIKEHIKDTKKNPLLIFPEGTCVNNEYCVMFKRGAFELGGSVIPIAIKYNKIFSNPHWNSKKESFQWHLFRLMTSWAVVCDVYYMKPQTPLRDESPAAFANRVKELICKKAGLTPVPWDGYLKHVRPSARFVELRQKAFAASLTKRSSSTNLAAMASDDGERDAKIREANSGLRDSNSSDSDMGPRRRSHVNFDELLPIKPEAAPSQDGATSPKKGAPEAKPVKSD